MGNTAVTLLWTFCRRAATRAGWGGFQDLHCHAQDIQCQLLLADSNGWGLVFCQWMHILRNDTVILMLEWRVCFAMESGVWILGCWHVRRPSFHATARTWGRFQSTAARFRLPCRYRTPYVSPTLLLSYCTTDTALYRVPIPSTEQSNRAVEILRSLKLQSFNRNYKY